MSFLQPWMLLALPLIALPVIIHLINQRRYQSVPWGAMMFLLTANRMSRGYARLRQWLILLFRTLAIAGLVFAISRPLASGWMGAAAGGSADVTIVLLDRSPSMSQRGQSTPVSKLETGRQQINDALQTLGAKRVVLIDSASPDPRELGPQESLAEAADTGANDAPADLPGMLLAALDYLQENQVAQADIWICSDLRVGDWQPTDGRWQSIREAFTPYENRVRFHLLAYPEVANDNRMVEVVSVSREPREGGADVVLSLKIAKTAVNSTAANSTANDATTAGDAIINTPLPIEFEIAGARSVLNVEMQGPEFELQSHRIPVAAPQLTNQPAAADNAGGTPSLAPGWGRVSIPGDSNPADNDYYFVFSEPPPRRTLIVSDDPSVIRPLELAGGIPPNSADQVEALVRTGTDLDDINWDELMLVLWHAPPPQADVLSQLQTWINRGGRVVFFPPPQPDDSELFGVRWGDWREPQQELTVQTWRRDADLLANTQNGQALPVGKLTVRRHVALAGEYTTLASLPEEQPLLVKAATTSGGVYFWTTTPDPSYSSLASDGVVFYVAVQRASLDAAAALSTTGSLIAGSTNEETAINWRKLAGREEAISTEQASTAGVYQQDNILTAVNRSPREDLATIVSDEQLANLFQDLRLDRVNDAAGNLEALVQEVWRAFLIGMMLALLIEAILCLPKVHPSGGLAA